MIKKIIFVMLASAVCLASLFSCSKMSTGEKELDNKGINFNLSAEACGDDDSRASYSGQIYGLGDKDYERIDWNVDDRISIAFYQSVQKSCEYCVKSVTASESSSKASILPVVPGSDLKWGGSTTYKFYAAHGCNSLTVTNKSAVANFTLPEQQLQGENSAWNGDTFIASPNKDYFLLTAQNKVTTSSTEEIPTDPVSLKFTMIPTVIEFVLSGEETMKVKEVKLENTNSSPSNIVGNFDATLTDLPDGAFATCSNLSSGKSDVYIDILDNGEPVVIEKGQKLKFTFFLYPRTQVSPLKFTITTIENHEGRTYEYTRGNTLKTSDGKSLSFAPHTKTVIGGFVVPKGVNWLYVSSLNIKEWTNDDAGTLGF